MSAVRVNARLCPMYAGPAMWRGSRYRDGLL